MFTVCGQGMRCFRHGVDLPPIQSRCPLTHSQREVLLDWPAGKFWSPAHGRFRQQTRKRSFCCANTAAPPAGVKHLLGSFAESNLREGDGAVVCYSRARPPPVPKSLGRRQRTNACAVISHKQKALKETQPLFTPFIQLSSRWMSW